jgi:transcription antitermination factor NusG
VLGDETLNSDQTARWYAIQVKPNKEKSVSLCLDSMNVRRFLPSFSTKVSAHERRQHDQRPLLSGYLFVHMRWHGGPKLYAVPGIIRILGTSRAPIPIEDSEIERLRLISEAPVHPRPRTYLAAGQHVTLVGGPLKGVSGIYLREGNVDRLVVSIRLMQRSLSVTLEASWIAPEDVSMGECGCHGAL